MKPLPGTMRFFASNTALYLGFILTGIVNTMLGPLLPTLSRHWGLTDTQAGEFFTAQFLASMLGVLASSVLTPRRGPAASLTLGFLLMAAGTGSLLSGSAHLGLVAACCFGFGLGLDIPTVNLLISDLNPGKRSASLSLVNMAWGVGAVLCPVLLIWQGQAGREPLFLHLVAASLVLMAAILFLMFQSFHRKSATAAEAAAAGDFRWTHPAVLPLAITFFLYVGTETAVGGWSASHARRFGGDSVFWLVVPSLFWLMLMVGRGLAPIFLRRIEELKLARIGLILATAGTAALIWFHDTRTLGIAAAVAGLGFACVYPIAISVLSSCFGLHAAKLAGPLFALAGLGGAVLPWLVGFVSTRSASLQIGLLVPLVGCFGLLACNFLLAHTSSKQI